MAKPFTRLSKAELINLITMHPIMDMVTPEEMLACCCICETKSQSKFWYVCDKCNAAADL